MISVLSSSDSLAIAILAPLAVSFLVAIGCGFGARALMRNKGRSGARGFCLGFFMGVIGVLIAALLSPTPEFEAVKMRRQMALMGITMPSGAVSGEAAPGVFYGNGTMPPPMNMAATEKSIPNRTSAIIALVVACGYSLLWVAFRIDRSVFGGTEEITLAVSIVALTLSILARAKPGNPIVGAAVGTTLAMSGTGIFFVSYAVFGHRLWTSNALGSLALDLLALASAAMLVFSDRNRGDRATQTSGLRNVAMVLAALGAVCALASANVYDVPWFVSRLPLTIGFGLVVFGMTRGSRVLLLFDLGWCVTTAFGVLSSKFQWFRQDGADAFGVVTLLCLIVLAAIAAVLYVQQPVTAGHPDDRYGGRSQRMARDSGAVANRSHTNGARCRATVGSRSVRPPSTSVLRRLGVDGSGRQRWCGVGRSSGGDSCPAAPRPGCGILAGHRLGRRMVDSIG